jgi:hypothetical protein
MEAEKTKDESVNINKEKLLSFVRELIGGGRSGREDDEHPLPPGPWDPVIRIALKRISVFGPQPEPWTVFGPEPIPWRIKEILGNPVPWKDLIEAFDQNEIIKPTPEPWRRAIFESIFDSWQETALNPQPLPPRFSFMLTLAQTVISRAELMQEIADATRREGEERGIIIVSGYVSRFVDDFCGNGFKLKFPFPGPRPRWFAEELSGIDLAVMATQFDQAAKKIYSPDLRRNLVDASAKLVEAGLSRI